MSKVLRCAVYTRKSSDEGLEQSFNSLDAQREAGEAYIKSQAHEGWKLLPARYDDGGFSGGTMERPGLVKLLADVDAGLVDVVVVYKIDRLTRSLADFARIVERFDAHEVSFVSVTQAFNTTSSMGRLTLNVLLSFAQFEREVTGERIRDKIAASKAKGMWMGGLPPIGYDMPEAGSRKLLVNEADAAIVRHIFARYLELGSVHALERDLTSRGITSRVHVTRSGKSLGGQPFSRGALFHVLRSRIYLGQIVHRGVAHEGEHDAIMDRDLFDAVQGKLDANARRHGAKAGARLVRAPLTGKLFDANGEPMSPAFSRGQRGKAYRYYVSSSLQQGARSIDGIAQRVPAAVIEALLTECLARWGQPGAIDAIGRVDIVQGGVVITLKGDRAAEVAPRLRESDRVIRASRSKTVAQVDAVIQRRGGRCEIASPGARTERRDPSLIGALRRGHKMLVRRGGVSHVEEAPASLYERRILRLAFLSPRIQADILAGRQPAAINLERLTKADIPLLWTEQEQVLGWR
ncbi:recombinase family protein [Parablastomonas sp. CN1-191]|uniref:recombinase family protein n=1 Tax=Parablastomonas sp. CN1-191 TaxID=3400908 RepID=UPI003BF91E75